MLIHQLHYRVSKYVRMYFSFFIHTFTVNSIHFLLSVEPYDLSVEANPGLELTFGENVTLTCTSQGGPTLNYTWMLPDNTEVTSDMLSVNNVMTNDTGEYICIVTSEAGNANTSVTLSG